LAGSDVASFNLHLGRKFVQIFLSEKYTYSLLRINENEGKQSQNTQIIFYENVDKKIKILSLSKHLSLAKVKTSKLGLDCSE